MSEHGVADGRRNRNRRGTAGPAPVPESEKASAPDNRFVRFRTKGQTFSPRALKTKPQPEQTSPMSEALKQMTTEVGAPVATSVVSSRARYSKKKGATNDN